jgi:ATP-dependent Clp protease ATP-binding subunit ClpC
MDEKAKDFIVAKGWDENYGARPLRRAIQRYVEDDLADQIIKSDILPGDTVKITAADGEEKITFDIEKGETSKQLDEALAAEPAAVEE